VKRAWNIIVLFSSLTNIPVVGYDVFAWIYRNRAFDGLDVFWMFSLATCFSLLLACESGEVLLFGRRS
jgi:hypothetical protein